ncbi:domain-containing protein 2 [Favolaschia claudopus]|uniref:Domain-containing protein 2 n=1 Tax=Favolaschia claudopus TaxID=2862362 RepID=A0AAW0BW96_9AGAR
MLRPSKQLDHILESTQPQPPLQAYPTPDFIYVVSLEEANFHLAKIQDGSTIGFDLESVNKPDRPKLSKAEKRAVLASQKRDMANFVIDWNDVDICLAQIATDGTVLVINFHAIKELPTEFVRICQSPDIVKVSAGIFSDGQRLWDSFRLDLYSAASLGLVARLAYPSEIYTGRPYGNEPGLALTVMHVLNFELPKELQMSEWNAETLSDAQKNYAAVDAHATLQAYQTMQNLIQSRGVPIEDNWYMFDIVERTRVERRTGMAWKANCRWWSPVPSEGFEAFR